MTLQEIIKVIQKECDKYNRTNYFDFFCGMTNNTERRRKEHRVESLIFRIKLLKKEYAEKVLSELSNLGFDIGNQIGNGQDDSLWVYVYLKTSKTKQFLATSFDLDFNQRWYNEEDYTEAPDSDGIYICVACDKQVKNNTYKSNKLIYIGITNDQGFKTRIEQHIHCDHSKWKKYYDSLSEQLVYAIAPIICDVKQTIESALIFENQPAANIEYKDHYQGEYDEITVNCCGYCGSKLQKSITSSFK